MTIFFTCFRVRVFPVLSFMYLAINSLRPAAKKQTQQTKKGSWLETVDMNDSEDVITWTEEGALSSRTEGASPTLGYRARRWPCQKRNKLELICQAWVNLFLGPIAKILEIYYFLNQIIL